MTDTTGVPDVTDDTFERDVLEVSDRVPVVLDLWAPWCGPCRQLGPILEAAVAGSGGRVTLAKANIDENPRIAATFQVQSIPAVFALSGRKVVDHFIGAQGERFVAAFIDRVAPPPSEADLLAAQGTEDALRRALELEPDNEGAVCSLAALLIDRGGSEEALHLLARIPENHETRRLAALARLAAVHDGAVSADEGAGADGIETRLGALLDKLPDDTARQEIVDILETMDPADPRVAAYRRAMTSRLY